mgnify:CR=1 FL=1
MSALSGVEGYLFGGAIVLFFILLIIEKKFPYMQIPKYELKASFKTNTGAFLINNVIMSVFSLSSLILVASNYSNFGLLGGMDDGPLKWILSFILFDFAVYVWHWLGHKYEFLWRFHKIHHSDKSYHVTTGLRFHVLDQALEVFVKCFCEKKIQFLLCFLVFKIFGIRSLEPLFQICNTKLNILNFWTIFRFKV